MGKKYSLAHPREIPEGKTVWIQCGIGEDHDGRVSILMTSIPINFDGKLWLFPKEDTPKDEPEPERKSYKANRGYVPKMHKQVAFKGRDTRQTVCGNFAPKGRLTDAWADVTCKNCLKDEPEETPDS